MLALQIQMEWLVERGYLLNIGLVLTLVAMICRVIPGIVIDHLLKDTENITLTKGKYIQNFKNRAIPWTFQLCEPINILLSWLKLKQIQNQVF